MGKMFRRIGVLVVFVFAIALVLTAAGKGPTAARGPMPDLPELPTVGSCAELAQMLEESWQRWGVSADSIAKESGIAAGSLLRAPIPAPAIAAGSDHGIEHSTTNIQVAGVDEADIVKTDGEHIYYVNKGRVLVVRAHPAAAMAVEKVIEFNGGFHPQELYLDAEHLVVVGVSFPHRVDETKTETKKRTTEIRDCNIEMVKAIAFDIRDKDNIVKVREVEIGGITHVPDSETELYRRLHFDDNWQVQRILFSGENLYTLSNELVKANDINTLAEKGRLKLP
jgi:uncharacterized secreted protein with C-terminal beta-propeller domain